VGGDKTKKKGPSKEGGIGTFVVLYLDPAALSSVAL